MLNQTQTQIELISLQKMQLSRLWQINMISCSANTMLMMEKQFPDGFTIKILHE